MDEKHTYILQNLSTGTHAFADDAKLKNIETIKTAFGGSESGPFCSDGSTDDYG